MKVNAVNSAYAAYAAPAAEEPSAQPHEAAEENAAGSAGENRDRVVLGAANEEKPVSYADDPAFSMSALGEKFKTPTSKPKDKTGNLTALLVAAAGQFEVRQVISEASSEMIELGMTASMGDDESKAAAKSIIRRLEKLISRAHKKIDSLNDEDTLRVRQKRAEHAKQAEHARQIKEELRKRLQQRKRKEQGYLHEENLRRTGEAAQTPAPAADPALEAQIAAQAEALAAAEIAAESAAGGFDAASTLPGGTQGGATASPAEGVAAAPAESVEAG